MSTMMTSYYKSRDGKHRICYHVWFPEGEPVGIVQIAHGMCEYVMRFDGFAKFLCSKGYIVCGNDHLGHGDSVGSPDDYGYFADRNGWETVVKDMHSLTLIMKKNYPELRYFLFGHSMGSFLSRAYMTWFGRELDGVILSGTAGPVKGTELLLLAIDAVKKKEGAHSRSAGLNKIAFGKYNVRIDDLRTEFDWLTRDDYVVDAYINDEKCGFCFTVNGFDTVKTGLGNLNRSNLACGEHIGEFKRGLFQQFVHHI